jgi:hypothetical protein
MATFVPQVMPTVQSAGRFVAPTVNPGAIGAQQTADLGQGLSRLGAQGMQLVQEEMQRQNADTVAAAMNDVVLARTRRTVDPEAGYANVRGAAALEQVDGRDFAQVWTERLQGDIDGIGQRLTNPEQQRAFKRASAQMVAEFRGKVLEHAGAEALRFRASTEAGAIDVAQKVMALQPGDIGAVVQAQDRIKSATAALGRLNGWSPEETLAKSVDNLSPGHESVIGWALREQKADYARAYMERVNAELTPAARDRLAQAVQIGARAEQTQSFGDEIMARGLSMADALDQARSRFSGADEDEAVKEVKIRFAEADAARAKAAREITNTAWAEAIDRGRMSPTTVSALRSAAPEQERQIRDWLEAKWRSAKADAEGREPPDSFSKFYGYVRMSQQEPAKFAELDLVRVQPYVTKAQLGHLLTLQSAVNRADAKAARLDNTLKMTLGMIKQDMRSVGINLVAKPGSEEAQEAEKFMGALTNALMDAAKGEALDPAQARQIGLNMLREGIEQGSGIFGAFQTKRRGYQIATDPSIPPNANFIALPFEKIPRDTMRALAAELPGGVRETRGGALILSDAEKEQIERAYTRGLNAGRFRELGR